MPEASPASSASPGRREEDRADGVPSQSTSASGDHPRKSMPKPHRCNYLLDPFVSAIVTEKSPSNAVAALKPFIACLRESPSDEAKED